MPETEHILVIPESVVDAIGRFDGFCDDVDRYLPAILNSDQLAFRPRPAMETDPSFKQLIPYVVLQHTADGGPHLFTYVRGGGGGESRLHAKKSFGIGGHIDRIDAGLDPVADPRRDAKIDGPTVYQAGMSRELSEEVRIDASYESEIIGLIYDPSTEVGRVHLGIVHRFILDQPAVTSLEDDLAGGQFEPVSQITKQRDRYETWSQLTLERLIQLR